MIYDSINSKIAQKNLPALFLETLAKLNVDTPCGKIDLIPGKLWINVSNAVARPAGNQLREVHRVFFDVQMVLEGEEICIVDHDEVHDPAGEYDSAGDYQLLNPGNGSENAFRLVPGRFLLITPDEPHLPMIVSRNYIAPHKKLVAKIHRSLLEQL